MLLDDFDGVGIIDITSNDDISQNSVGSVDAYLDHLEQVVQWWNTALHESQLSNGKKLSQYISFSADRFIEASKVNPDSLRSRQHIHRFSSSQEGRIYQNQIRTTTKIIANVLDNHEKSGVVVGGCLSGKTGTSNNCYWIAPLLYLITGKYYLTVTLIPNFKGMEDQTNMEQQGFMDFYKDMVIRITKGSQFKEITLGSYYNELRVKYPKISDRIQDLNRKKSGVSDGEVVRRSKGCNKNFICEMVTLTDSLGVKIIFLVDEPHHGASVENGNGRGRNSLQYEMMKDSEIFKLYEDTNQVLKKHSDIMIGFSATPWQLWGRVQDNTIWGVRSHLAPNWCGHNMFMGESIDPDVVSIPPDHCSFLDFAKKSKIHDFQHIHIAWYCNEDSFELEKEKKRSCFQAGKADSLWELDKMNHHDYRVMVETAIAKAINWCLIGKGKKMSGNGLLFRWKNNNTLTKDLFSELRLHGLSNKIVVAYCNGENGKGQAIREWCRREGLTGDKPTVIAFTGRGRMGDNPPVWCKHGLNFTAQSGLTALIQDLIGRLGGVGKDTPPPLVVISNDNATLYDEYLRRIADPSTDPHHDVDRTGANGKKARRGKPLISVTLRKHKTEKHPILREVWRSLQGIVDSSYIVPYSYKTPVCRGTPFVWKILNKEVLDYMEDNADDLFDESLVNQPKLLRPKERDADNWGWALGNKPGTGRMGFRNTGSPSSENSNLPSDRFKPGGQNRCSENRDALEVQAHVGFNPLTRQWNLVAIRLRLKDRVSKCDNSPSKLTPKNTTLAYKILKK